MYQKIIDKAIKRRDEIRQAGRGSDAGEWHPSGMTGCLRQAVYSYRGEPESDERDVRSIRIMDRGTEMHEFIQRALIDQYPGTLLEVRVEHAGVVGHCDALVPVADGIGSGTELTPTYELQEFKSIGPIGKRYMKGGPKPEHAQQARIYYWALQRMGFLLDGIRIVYMDRDDWSILEYFVDPWDEQEERDFEGLLDDLNAHVEEGTLPDRMPDDYWLCRYCQYRTTCKG